MAKNLIYYSFNSAYQELFDLHMNSLRRFGKFDCLVLNDTQNATPFEASANKLKIYQYDLSNYDNVLYCDVDTIWNKSPNDIFETITDDKIYCVNEQQLMNHEAGYWGSYFFTDEQRADITNKNILGINGGVFGFKRNMAVTFKAIEDFVNENKAIHNGVYEQPFMNVYLYANDLINNSLNDFVCNSYDGTIEDKHLIHFLGGSSESKLEKMRNYFK